METAELFGKRAKARMEDLGLTQIQLAERLGIPQSGVSRSLSGRMLPRTDKLAKWAKALETTPQWLLGTDTQAHKPPPPREPTDLDVVLFMLKGVKIDDKRRFVIETVLNKDCSESLIFALYNLADRSVNDTDSVNHKSKAAR